MVFASFSDPLRLMANSSLLFRPLGFSLNAYASVFKNSSIYTGYLNTIFYVVVGAGAIYGYRTPAKVKWSEEYQSETLEKQLTAILSREDVSGVYIWQFCDCRVCDSWFGIRPRTMDNKGIVDEYRRPKLAYETVKRIFSEF